MKQYALFAASAIVALAACSKTEVKPQTPEPPVDENSPVAVQFGVSAPLSASVATKSYGPLDEWNEQKSLYIYSFAKQADNIDYSTATPFIDNVFADAPATGETVLDVTNPAYPGEPFYYNDDLIYDFYGYYVDDAWATGTAVDDYATVPVDNVTNLAPVKKETSRIYIPFLINGSQDLMIAKADAQADFEKTTDETFKGDPTNVQYVYSAYAARRGVQPNLKFEHQLARFNFIIKSKSESANKLQVESVGIESKYKGDLVVVANTDEERGILNTSETKALLPLMYNNNGTLEEFEPVPVNDLTGSEATGETEEQPLGNGSGIMVIPGEESYNITIGLGYDPAAFAPDAVPDTPIAPIETTVYFKNVTRPDEAATSDVFLKGEQYTITIYIIGPQEVEISAEVTEWLDGGSTVIDPDQPPTVPGADDEEQGGGTTPEPEPEPGA